MNELSLKVKRASSFWSRARGLLNTKKFPRGFDGLYLEPCSAVHTLGMHYDIDLLFLDKNLRVVKIEKWVAPQRFSIACKDAYGVVELRAGKACDFWLGQKICLRYVREEL